MVIGGVTVLLNYEVLYLPALILLVREDYKCPYGKKLL